MRRANWQTIWEKKYENCSLTVPHVAAGFDALKEEQWKRLVNYFLKILDISGHDNIIEVGCGCGAFLENIRNYNSLAGVDYSANSIQIIKKRLRGKFYVSEASALPFEDSEFDLILSFSVFFYFKSYDYAKKVIREMIRVKREKGKIFIGDISDIEKYEIAKEIREKKNKDKLISGSLVCQDTPDHLYYPKEFFKDVALENKLKINIFDEDVEELSFYDNSKYRYSILLY